MVKYLSDSKSENFIFIFKLLILIKLFYYNYKLVYYFFKILKII